MPKKWDDDATPSKKLLVLFATLFFNNRPYSLKELSGPDYLNASKPTVLRYIRELELANVGNLQREKAGREVYYRLERAVRLPAVSMNAEGLRQLALCRDFLCGLLPEKMRAQMDMALNQAISYLPAGSQHFPAGIAGSLGKGRIDYTPFQAVLIALMEAILSGKVCEVEYRSASGGENKKYAFAPKRILAYHECLYIDGWLVNGEKTPELVYADPLRLALQRFLSCAITYKSSAALPDLPLPDNKAMGVMRDEEFEVKIRFAPEAATYVAERQWSATQTITRLEDGSIILAANMSSLPEAVSWILSFGDRATVLEPDWLIKQIKKVLRGIIKNYVALKKAGRQPENQ